MISNFENITGIVEMMQISNSMTGGWFYYSIPITVWGVIFFSTMSWGRSEAIVSASFITGVILAILNMVGAISYWLIVVDLILLALGLFMLISSRA